MFEYPLRQDELYAHQGSGFSEKEFEALLNGLVTDKLLLYSNAFYFSPLANPAIIEKRLKGNAAALAMMPTAVKWGKRLFRFPFVRSISLSGSLSKNYFDEHSDIDFFIVTKANRLWICRTLLILYWKLSSKENQKKFCTNYFVDETVLEWEEQNRFTATELNYLLPIVNGNACQKILSSNNWINPYINNKPLDQQYELPAPTTILGKLLEFLLDNAFGDRLENFLLKKTIERWRKKYPELAAEDFELQFRSRKNVCKRHTKGFQNKVLKLMEQKTVAYSHHTGVQLN